MLYAIVSIPFQRGQTIARTKTAAATETTSSSTAEMKGAGRFEITLGKLVYVLNREIEREKNLK